MDVIYCAPEAACSKSRYFKSDFFMQFPQYQFISCTLISPQKPIALFSGHTLLTKFLIIHGTLAPI